MAKMVKIVDGLPMDGHSTHNVTIRSRGKEVTCEGLMYLPKDDKEELLALFKEWMIYARMGMEGFKEG